MEQPKNLLKVTLEQAQQILDHHRHGSTPIASFKQLKGTGYTAFSPTATYEVTLGEPEGETYLLKVAHLTASLNTPYGSNTLVAEHAFLQRLATSTSIPHPIPHALDTSLALLQYPYLLLSRPRGVPLSRARAHLSQRQALALDLRLGAYLKELHEIQNDWFGTPAQESAGIFSWQEAITGLVEALLEEAESRGVVLPYQDLRAYLSRAIGFYLFDDCEVPSLISFTGDQDAVILDLDLEKHTEEDEIRVSSFLRWEHALWGDPLMETMFLDPSQAFIEGYGGPLVYFPRQKTKRLWYTMFLCLAVVTQALRTGEPEDVENDEKVRWAKELLNETVVKLKDAPCW